MVDRPVTLVLVGLGPEDQVRLSGRERADHALLAARRSGVPVIHVTGPDADGAAPEAGPAPEGPVRLALTPGDPVSEERLVRVLGPHPGEVAVAGTPTGGLLAEVARALQEAGAEVIVLEDACGDEEEERHEVALHQLPSGVHLSSTADWVADLGPRRRFSRSRIISTVSFAVAAVLIVVAVVWANHEAKHYYLLSPGSAPVLTSSPTCKVHSSSDPDLTLPDGEPCARIDVPADRAHPIDGSLRMVDVLEGQASWTDWVQKELGLFKTFHNGSQLFPATDILGSTPADQLQCENEQEAVQATTDAPVAALQHLGYDVHERDLGAQVDLVMPGFPAATAGLACNDVINSINGHTVTTEQSASQILGGFAPGQTVALGVASPGAKGAVKQHTVNVKLTSTPSESGAPAEPNKAFLGVELETRSTYELPFNVTANVGDIGGPSDGLAITLGIMDLLSDGKLTGGHPVAATGTIDPSGAVGDVGGVAQKAVAVRKAGARYFLVPPEEVAAATSEDDGGKLKVYSVSSLSQALAILARLGGTVPKPVAAGSAPSGSAATGGG